MGWLVVTAGAQTGMQHRLVKTNLIGRDPARCDLVLDDDTISAEHVRVKYERRRFVLYDLGSTNGTRVNGEPVQRYILEDGDKITLGHTELIFKAVLA